ncbi:hypothetical protein POVWA2_031940 [Plasmodium ovale wallikeri]|uniref:Uncharacterized protein n=1 Tax=Plasmodium ovale wallikeri TaxID=864142 RepID=A0A1A8YY65_PLAOA|nr:hypothetical protein POVWA1_032310 [Plasmodium ovale wallikeri]SBT36793.1 hypothetical protein POVWA2_031940 [Plasmodium ovale wallikeri]
MAHAYACIFISPAPARKRWCHSLKKYEKKLEKIKTLEGYAQCTVLVSGDETHQIVEKDIVTLRTFQPASSDAACPHSSARLHIAMSPHWHIKFF